MRNFEVTLTYKPLIVNQFISKSILIDKRKIVEGELDEEVCISAEEFCKAVISLQERPDVLRINIVERFSLHTGFTKQENSNLVFQLYSRCGCKQPNQDGFDYDPPQLAPKLETISRGRILHVQGSGLLWQGAGVYDMDSQADGDDAEVALKHDL